jgi:hypothetical protein
MLERDPNNYYKTNGLLKFLRFLNLLEPDVNILSISKILMWLMIFITVFVLFMAPEQLEVVLVAVGSLMASLMNYSYRRWIHYKTNIYDTKSEDRDVQNDFDDGRNR